MRIFVDGERLDGVHGATHITNKDQFRAYIVMGGNFDDTFTVLAENEVAACRLTDRRALHTNLRNTSGTEIASAVSLGGPLATNTYSSLAIFKGLMEESYSDEIITFNGSSLTSIYQTLVSLSAAQILALFIRNSCNQKIDIGIANDTLFTLESGESISYEFGANNFYTDASGVILQAKHLGVVPNYGQIKVHYFFYPTF